MIPHSRPWIAGDDLEAVAGVLRSGQIAEGPTTARFEAAMSQWLGLRHPGVAVGSGAAAHQLALLALDVSSGDEVVLPTYVCRSVLDVVRASGATPVLADVGPQWVVTPATVAALVGERTRAIIVPHLYGIFADVAAFRTFGVPIIEDCGQAVDCPPRWALEGDVGVFSFHPTECLTTGEGGLAAAWDSSLNMRLRGFRDGRLSARRVLAPMSDVAAALGLSQLARYDVALERRRLIAGTYRHALGEAAGPLLRRTPWDRTMHFRFVMSSEGGLDAQAAAFARKRVIVRRGVDELLYRPSNYAVLHKGVVVGSVEFSGRGWGHGVGMSQYGAQALALQGWTYDRILTYYYQGTVLEQR